MKTRLEKEPFNWRSTYRTLYSLSLYCAKITYLKAWSKNKGICLKQKVKPVLFISTRLRDSPKNRCGMRKSKQKKHNWKIFYLLLHTWLGTDCGSAEKLVGKLHVEAKWRLKNASFKLDLHSVTSFSRISFTKFNGKSKIFHFH